MTAPEWVKTVADARRYWAEKAAADARVRAERRARGESAPRPATPEEQRVAAADRARHEQYGRAEILLRADEDEFEREAAQQWDAERDALHNAGRIAGSDAFHATNHEET